MDAWVWIVIAIAAVAVMAVVLLAAMARRRRHRKTEALRRSFGDEYDRRVRDTGDRRAAESQLVDVRDRHDQLRLQPLNAATRSRFMGRWQEVQSRFVDQPGHALDAADVLVREVVAARGYPSDDRDEQVDLLALDHPDVVRHLRAAGDTLERARAGMAGTEDVRVAMIQYRSVFETLIAASDDVTGGESSRVGGPPAEVRPAPPARM
jgi:hypothetical protein